MASWTTKQAQDSYLLRYFCSFSFSRSISINLSIQGAKANPIRIVHSISMSIIFQVSIVYSCLPLLYTEQSPRERTSNPRVCRHPEATSPLATSTTWPQRQGGDLWRDDLQSNGKGLAANTSIHPPETTPLLYLDTSANPHPKKKSHIGQGGL